MKSQKPAERLMAFTQIPAVFFRKPALFADDVPLHKPDDKSDAYHKLCILKDHILSQLLFFGDVIIDKNPSSNNIFGALAKVKDVKALLMSEHESIVLNIVEMFNRAQGLMKTASKLFINSLIDWFNSNRASLREANIPTPKEFSDLSTNGILPEEHHFYLISEWFHFHNSCDLTAPYRQSIYSYITNGIDLSNCPNERIKCFKQTDSAILEGCFSGQGTDVFSMISLLGGTGKVERYSPRKNGTPHVFAFDFSFSPNPIFVEFLKASNRLLGPPKEVAKKQKKQKRKQKCNRPPTEKKQKIDGDGEQTNEQEVPNDNGEAPSIGQLPPHSPRCFDRSLDFGPNPDEVANNKPSSPSSFHYQLRCPTHDDVLQLTDTPLNKYVAEHRNATAANRVERTIGMSNRPVNDPYGYLDQTYHLESAYRVNDPNQNDDNIQQMEPFSSVDYTFY